MSIVLWDKKYTETLALTLERFRREKPEYQNAKITYAGRLDPMAEGLLVLLTDEDVHKKEDFLSLDKVYEVEFILGVSTDSYDILGLITQSSDIFNIQESAVKEIVNSFTNIQQQVYPAYSSKTVAGKPLWEYTRAGMLPKNLPTKNVTITESTYLGSRQDSKLDLKILTAVERVQGDFRQEIIARSWEQYFKEHKNQDIYHMRIHASSGTYMRSLVHTLGQELGIGATTLKIKRLSIGNNTLT